jgi:putative ABC transport system permease protein
MYFPYLPAIATTSDDVNLHSYLHPDKMTLVIRATGDLAQVARAADDVVHEMNRDVVVSSTGTLASIVATQFVQPRFYLILLGSFAFVALALAAVGIYGVISYSVSQRTRELGVRAALGAERSDALTLVMRQGLALAAAGGAIGIVGAVISMRFAQAMLFQVKPTDPITLGVVCAVLALVALTASYLPARRAAAVDPVIALRAD